MLKEKSYFILKSFTAMLLVMIVLCTGVLSANAGRKKDNDFQSEAFAGGMEGYYRKAVSEGVKNTLLRARQMYEVEWTPLQNMSMYDTEEETSKQFLAGITYKGIPYGQPVHQGVYVGQTVTIQEFIAASQDVNSDFYTKRGLNTWYYDEGAGDGKIRFGPYMASDCSSFVSYCWMLEGRVVTGTMAEDKERFIVVGKDIQKIEPGMAINKGYSHVILIYDVIYDKDGKVAGITTIEQTPPIMTMRSYGVGGNTGTLEDFKAKLNNGYDIIRYRDIEKVKYTAIEGVDKDRTFVSGVEYPISDIQLSNTVKGTAVVKEGDIVEIKGWAFHKEEFESFYISVDGGEEKEIKAEKRGGYAEKSGLYYDFADNKGKNYYSVKINDELKEQSVVTVIGKTKIGNKVELAQISLVNEFAVEKPLKFESYFDLGATIKEEDGVYRHKRMVSSEADLLIEYAGWTMCNKNIIRFEMCLDDGPWQEVSGDFRADVYAAKKILYKDSRNLNAYIGKMDLSYLDKYKDHKVELRAVTVDNQIFTVAEWELVSDCTNPTSIVLWFCVGIVAFAIAIVTVIFSVRSLRKGKKSSERDSVVSTEETVQNTEEGPEM